jgi:hypothetical protein
MMGGDGCHFPEIDVWRIIHGSQQIGVSHLFAFLYLTCLCLLVWGLIPRMGTTHRWERRISFVLRVFFPSVFVYWLDFFVLTCMLFYVSEFVYIATLAE